MKPYVIKAGDHLAKLAFTFGFSASGIWNDATNAELKAKRKTGDVLLPGDILYIPDGPGQKVKYTKEIVNRYKTTVPTVKVEVVLADPEGKPLVGESFVVKGLGDESVQVTADDGKISFDASILQTHVEVSLTGREQTLRVMVGGLDPAAEISGARMRLENLGLYGATFASSGNEPAYPTSDEDRLAAAVSAFQAAKNLVTTGKLDPTTVAALIEAHGS